jgi:hypothetical protein
MAARHRRTAVRTDAREPTDVRGTPPVSRVPSRPRRHTGFRRATAACAAVLAWGVAPTGCGTPPELRDPTAGAAPRPGTATASPPPSTALPAPDPSTPAGGAATPVAGPGTPTGPPGFDEAVAVACRGQPSGSQVVDALRRTAGLLPDGIRLRVGNGPFCAGTWQYTTVRVLMNPEPEPLQVVTRGRPRALTVVTTGTNVCSIGVRVEAPPGIRALACDAAPLPAAS